LTVPFNAITIDGDTSTNDTCLVMANGAAGNQLITAGTPEAAEFAALLERVMLDLAKAIVRDGEGATKFVEIRITGAADDADARRAALAVANSSLVKTAFFGQDANWGRIFAAVGYSGAQVNPDLLSLWFDNVQMAKMAFLPVAMPKRAAVKCCAAKSLPLPWRWGWEAAVPLSLPVTCPMNT